MIAVRHLTKTFGGLVAVKDVSFEIGKGEIFAFLGPNGAGRTTTVKMLTTLLKPTSGRVEIEGLISANFKAVQRSQTRYDVGEPSRFARFCGGQSGDASPTLRLS